MTALSIGTCFEQVSLRVTSYGRIVPVAYETTVPYFLLATCASVVAFLISPADGIGALAAGAPQRH